MISARYTWAKTESDSALAATALNSTTVPANNLTFPSSDTYNGEYINQSFALSWTANPMTAVDSRVYYYWTKMQNNSDLVEYGHAPTQQLPTGLSCGYLTGTSIRGNCDSENFDYTKNNVGFDVWWRFTRGQKVGFGYDFLDLEQERFDYSGTQTQKFFVEYKNTMLENFSARVKYQYITHDSDSNFSNVGVSANNPDYLYPYTSAFDMQAFTANQLKLNLDWTPTQLLALSFEANVMKQEYDDVTFGRTEADRQGYYLSANWGDPNKFIINGFGSWEEVKYPSNHRYIGTIAAARRRHRHGARRRTRTASARARRRRPAPTTGIRSRRTRRG